MARSPKVLIRVLQPGPWRSTALPRVTLDLVPRVQSEALIGRHDELDLLEAALSAARAGKGSVVIVSGEAGIGKSQLAREAADRAASSGMRLLRGRAVPAATHVPFRAFAEALRSIDRDRAAAFVREIGPYGRAPKLPVGRGQPNVVTFGSVVGGERLCDPSEASLRNPSRNPEGRRHRSGWAIHCALGLGTL
jgi:hypothetical protein